MSPGLLIPVIYAGSKRRYFRFMIFDINSQHIPRINLLAGSINNVKTANAAAGMINRLIR